MSGTAYFIIVLLSSVYLFSIKQAHEEHGFGRSLYLTIMSSLSICVMLLGNPVVWMAFTLIGVIKTLYLPSQADLINEQKFDHPTRMSQSILRVMLSAAIFFSFQHFR